MLQMIYFMLSLPILEEILFDWCDFIASAICVFPISGILYSHTIYHLVSKCFDLQELIVRVDKRNLFDGSTLN